MVRNARPKLVHFRRARNITVENLFLRNSPLWHLEVDECIGLVVRYVKIDARITQQDNHNLLDMSALNTDGIDVTGRDHYIHDTEIWCQDDCISVKDGSQDMLFERISCSGVGLVVGSIGGSIVSLLKISDIRELHFYDV